MTPTEKMGLKYDSEKPMAHLIDPNWIIETAEVLTFGANKYAPNNWQGLEKERVLGAAYRHLLAYHSGEVLDQESGLPHLAHLSCCIMFLSYFDRNKP